MPTLMLDSAEAAGRAAGERSAQITGTPRERAHRKATSSGLKSDKGQKPI